MEIRYQMQGEPPPPPPEPPPPPPPEIDPGWEKPPEKHGPEKEAEVA